MCEISFSEKLGEVHVHSSPQVLSFSLKYGQGIGWLCYIQESRFVEVHTGTGGTWHEAMDKALHSLKYEKEQSNA